MNQSLTALMTKLNWQRTELNTHLQSVENESGKVKLQLEELEQKLNQSCVTPFLINPELEINRLNFIAQLNEQKETLGLILKKHQALEIKLKDKLHRTKTELKMLERYLEREQHNQQGQQKKIHEHSLDEWVIQKRNRYENQ
ncbi:hypothetical protein [Legionella maioricensis]|uniref:Flagellar FliJ protein n=1 Tax=Legionella maioricensis TaxID=2896528 RepID=A0A9X2CXP7_9GAMM|nr:hypothetical protein [Legionella maioricensis]MCL9682636.1 hypothetical protein [Legionella maioricensis]MCL9687317.1 hypothetical protein [Legionella maioricensis]